MLQHGKAIESATFYIEMKAHQYTAGLEDCSETPLFHNDRHQKNLCYRLTYVEPHIKPTIPLKPQKTCFAQTTECNI